MITAGDNPFRSQLIDALDYHFIDATWGELLTRLEQHCYRGAIIGAHGSGKTTLLEKINKHLQSQGWSTLHLRLAGTHKKLTPSQWRAMIALTSRDCVLLDGAEQLSFLQWKRLLRCTRRGGGLIITTHRSGRLPVLHKCRTSPELLNELVAELAQQQWDEPSLRVLYARHNGNIRHALRELYNFAAEKKNEEDDRFSSSSFN